MSNINFKWLTKFDFKGRFKINDNIPDSSIDIAVNDAYEFDVLTTLPNELMDDIKAVLLVNPIQWKSTTTYIAGDKVFYDGVYYECVTGNTNSLPTSANANWEVIELMNFWLNYVKPFFEACAYYRFLVWHGANITQYGVRQNQEDTSQEISSTRKGELLADVSGKKDIYLARLTTFFDNTANTFDGTLYAYDDNDTQKLNQGIRVWGVGKTSKRYPDKRRCCPDDYDQTIPL